MVYIAICDSKSHDQELLKQLIIRYMKSKFSKCIIDHYLSEMELIKCIETDKKYDAVFFNISMEDKGRIETAQRVKENNPNIHMVLVAESMDYVLEGYKVEAVRYLLKDRLEETIEECMDTIIEKMHHQYNLMTFSFIDGEELIDVDKIQYIESDKHKLNFVMQNEVQRYGLYDRLDNVESELCGYPFIRVHKSYLVNMKYIQSINSYKIQLRNGTEMSVPKVRYPEVKNAFALYRETVLSQTSM